MTAYSRIGRGQTTWPVFLNFALIISLVKKVKLSHTRYRALGLELIPVYRQSARRWLEATHPVVRLPLLSARPAVTFPAEERYRLSAGTKLYCLVTEAHACEQLAQDCYLEEDRPRFEPASLRIASERSAVKPHRPPVCWLIQRCTSAWVSKGMC